MSAASSDVWEVMSTARTIRRPPSCCSGGSIFPAIQNFLLAARAQGLGACLTSWAFYGGEQLLRDAVGVPDDWSLRATSWWAGRRASTGLCAAAHLPRR